MKKVDINKAIDQFNRKRKKSEPVMTITSLAELTGYSRRTLYNVINGVNNGVNIDLVIKVSEATGVPICEFTKLKLK